MVKSSQCTAASILGSRFESTSNPHYYLSAGIYNGLMFHVLDPTYQASLEVLLSKSEVDFSKASQAHVWGVSCDSVDDIGLYTLPELQIGDWVLYRNVGDYHMEMCSNFNGFGEPQREFCCEARHLDICEELYRDQFDILY